MRPLAHGFVPYPRRLDGRNRAGGLARSSIQVVNTWTHARYAVSTSLAICSRLWISDSRYPLCSWGSTSPSKTLSSRRPAFAVRTYAPLPGCFLIKPAPERFTISALEKTVPNEAGAIKRHHRRRRRSSMSRTLKRIPAHPFPDSCSPPKPTLCRFRHKLNFGGPTAACFQKV